MIIEHDATLPGKSDEDEVKERHIVPSSFNITAKVLHKISTAGADGVLLTTHEELLQ